MNNKMKNLSLAVLGFVGFAAAGAAMAQCPASPSPPWSSVSAFQGGVAIVAGGYASTACRLDSKINAGAGGAASAQVNWTGTGPEARYRAQFLVNADNLTSQGLLQTVSIFSAGSTSGGDGVEFTIFGNGTVRNLSYTVRNAANGSGYETGVVPLAAGINRIEFDFGVGASTFKLWLNSNVEATATRSVAINNPATYLGIDTTYLGLGGPSPQYVSAFATKTVGFDQFDSRRQTFIGF